MTRIFSNLRELAADFHAAIVAAAAVNAHRQPPAKALRRLGIAEQDLAGVRY